jgi:hypothetical protein
MISGMMRCLRRANSPVGSWPSADRNEQAQNEQNRAASSGRVCTMVLASSGAYAELILLSCVW